MENLQLLEKHGLFQSKVPRYTSYPPANTFVPGIGQKRGADWLGRIAVHDRVSVYVHIPFCSRLCWFCACRTQGTKTLRPVETYVATLLNEIDLVCRLLPRDVHMSRLHLGGGTPTLLSPVLMDRLLAKIHERFRKAPDFEFSVEIDPTDASDRLLDCLAGWDLDRASIGVQDFDPKVQEAIGRAQSHQQTRDVVGKLRANGVGSVNLDLLYGLPFQTEETLGKTLQQVLDLNPDRLALYGYAHVPHMSKRQVMINVEALPTACERHRLARMSADWFARHDYEPLGIDHFAKPADSLARAARLRQMRRNFQGYTDDPCDTLLGFGASAISRFPGGYVQNAVATAAWSDRIGMGHLPGHRGFEMTGDDKVVGSLIQSLMCYGDVRLADHAQSGAQRQRAFDILSGVAAEFSDVVDFDGSVLKVRDEAISLIRILAARMDAHRDIKAGHSLAI